MDIFVDSSQGALRESCIRVFRIVNPAILPVGINVISAGWLAAVTRDKEALLISAARSFWVLLIILFTFTALWGGEGIWWTPLANEAICCFLSVWMLKKAVKRISGRPA